MEQTFVMVKPDGVQRNLIGEIVSRFEQKGYQLIGAKFMQISEPLAKTHYAEHQGKPFFDNLVSFITSGPVFAMVWQGKDVIQVSRAIIGKTNPTEATPGTIRGDYGIVTHKNIIHGSDSEESAKREIELFFQQDELVSYAKDVNTWLQ
ncbi:multifunctional nucleoside diphosphate kinase/apyrimidinic endonuclease/3'-phosphodiesterase [Gracilibacillus halophilus YIM-C55.5]|uniref:Nucleoside diphosphate kinase n=1 Tax=Gracilibacillus halophilus YIM-C55.5 TaxID=1308866 RepID=N4WSH1_9BACI|nr:nucleoside-diphosphate kinase [Gracilibacillus halophilus]ENH97340.1 multifunctional nucleoside diphosphate kinase/apyrimidinic endonuclease/3'-phosphodiesterase [Gracilibacillus halophilus YIM-C55.5]